MSASQIDKYIPYIIGGIVLILILFFVFFNNKGTNIGNTGSVSKFNNVLKGDSGSINDLTPVLLNPKNDYSSISNNNSNNINVEPEGVTEVLPEILELNINKNIRLLKPDVREEDGFPLYGAGVSMERNDSNVLNSTNDNGPLHTSLSKNESIGESVYTDQYGSRILKINSTGSQSNFKATDEAEYRKYAAAYNNEIEIPLGEYFLNNNTFVNYTDNFVPDNNILTEASPGSMTESTNCEQTLPRTTKSSGYCLSDVDLPYKEVTNGKVNPRLVSRWESYTGNYDPQAVVNSSGSGNLFPKI
jgi:hypothetical protein